MGQMICVLLGYAVGCIQSAYFVGRVMHKDIRNYGSGNLGSTNALRVLGKRAGAVTFACDILKSVAAFLLSGLFFPNLAGAGAFACAGVVLGHDFPFYLGFKGGKGIASMIGLVLCLGVQAPLVMGLSFGVGIIGLLTGYVSVGSLLFAAMIPVSVYITGFPKEVILLASGLGILAFYQHRANIRRLLSGEENKVIRRKAE